MVRAKNEERLLVNRAVYDPAIREVIARGELEQMESVLVEAKSTVRQQGDLKAAIARLEKAIRTVKKSKS